MRPCLQDSIERGARKHSTLSKRPTIIFITAFSGRFFSGMCPGKSPSLAAAPDLRGDSGLFRPKSLQTPGPVRLLLYPARDTRNRTANRMPAVLTAYLVADTVSNGQALRPIRRIDLLLCSRTLATVDCRPSCRVTAAPPTAQDMTLTVWIQPPGPQCLTKAAKRNEHSAPCVCRTHGTECFVFSGGLL